VLKRKKGGDTNAVKPLEQCLHNNQKSIRPLVCAALKPCEAKVSATCKTRGQEIHKALCLCKKDHELAVAGKLKALGQHQKVSIPELIKTVADEKEIHEFMSVVGRCFHEHHERLPHILQHMMHAGGARKGGPAINGKSLIIMSDLLALDAYDKSDCEKCP